MMQGAGQYRSVVDVLRRTVSRGDNAEPLLTFEFAGRASASIAGSGDRRPGSATSDVDEQRFVIRLRYTPKLSSIQPDDRLRHGLRLFDVIDATNTEERNVELVINARLSKPDAVEQEDAD